MKEEAIKAPGSTIRQYSIMLQNRVGALSALLGLLDMHGIFCLGFSMHDCHEATIARLIVSDPERTSEIFLERASATRSPRFWWRFSAMAPRTSRSAWMCCMPRK